MKYVHGIRVTRSEPSPRSLPQTLPQTLSPKALALACAVASILLVSACTTGEREENSSSTEQCDNTDLECHERPESSSERLDFDIPDGYLGVKSVGSLTPIPTGPWTSGTGPGSSSAIASDTHSMRINHYDNWISQLEVGLYSEFSLDVKGDTLEEYAGSALDAWVNGSGFSCTTNPVISPIEVSYLRVDGKPAAVADTRITWDDGGDCTTDAWEDVTLLLVEVDEEGTLFAGLASIPESGTAHYDRAVEALMATTFSDAEYLLLG